jgi:hypothetical protein
LHWAVGPCKSWSLLKKASKYTVVYGGQDLNDIVTGLMGKVKKGLGLYMFNVHFVRNNYQFSYALAADKILILLLQNKILSHIFDDSHLFLKPPGINIVYLCQQ